MGIENERMNEPRQSAVVEIYRHTHIYIYFTHQLLVFVELIRKHRADDCVSALSPISAVSTGGAGKVSAVPDEHCVDICPDL